MKREQTPSRVIITEGEFEASVLKKLFQGESPSYNISILPSNGYSSALSKGRSIMTLQHDRVALLLDTNTLDENEINQKKEFVNTYLGLRNKVEDFRVFWAKPEFEVIFIKNYHFLNALLKKNPQKSFIELGRISPKTTLDKISKLPRESFLTIINDKNIHEDFFKDDLIKDIYTFIYKEIKAK